MTNHKLCQFIVKKYITGNINWPREIKIAQKLIKKYKNYAFWNNLSDLASPPPSLAWFLKPEGKSFLSREYGKFKLNLKIKKINLDQNKFGEDKKIIKNPKNIIDFIKVKI